MNKTNIILHWRWMSEKPYTNTHISLKNWENFLQMYPEHKTHLYKKSSKATDGTSQLHDKVQQIHNLHAKRFYKLGNKVLRPMGVPFKIKNHSKKRPFKAVTIFSYIKQYDCFKESMSYISITEISH